MADYTFTGSIAAHPGEVWKTVRAFTEGEGMPFEDYHSTMTVEPKGDTTELVWEATYEPVGDPDVAAKTIEAIYSGGFAALKKHLES